MAEEKTFILSDESINSYGFVMLTTGLMLEQFKKNPVMLFNHKDFGPDYTGPIGYWKNIRVENGKLLAEPVFDDNDEFAQAIKSKVEGGFLKAASIGFNIVESSTDPQVMKKGQTRPTVTKAFVYEASVVDLPGNYNALALYDDSGKRIELKGDGSDAINEILPLFPSPQNSSMKLNSKTAQQLKLAKDDATAEEIADAVNALNERAETAEKDLEKLRKQVEADVKLRAQQLIDDAIAEKKLTASDREEWLKQAEGNYDFTQKAIGKLSAPKLPAGDIKPEEGGAKQHKLQLTKEQQAMSLRDLEKKCPDVVLKLRNQDWEQYSELYKKEYGKEPKK